MKELRVETLSGQHVILERLRAEHIDEIASAAGGDRSTFDKTPVPNGVDETERYVRGLLAQADKSHVAPFVQRRASDGLVVGCTRYLDPHWTLARDDPDEVEIGGTWLSVDAQRTAINSEAKLLLLTHAFETWSVKRLAICTDERNTRSREAIERLGANLDGILPNHRLSRAVGEPDGMRTTAVYSIIDTGWPAVRDRLQARLR